MSVRRSLIFLVVATIASSAGVAYLLNAGEQARLAEQATAIENMETYVVSEGSVQSVVTALGTIEAEDSVNLRFQVDGEVADVLVETGDYVLEGDTLVRLDNESQRIAHEQALIAIERAELALQDTLEPPDENDIRIAQANLDSAQANLLDLSASGASADAINAAQLRYEAAQAELDAAQRARVLTGGDPETTDLAEARLGQATFDAEIARLRVEDLRASGSSSIGEARALVAQRELELEQVRTGARPGQIRDAELALERAIAHLEDIERQDAQTRLMAPNGGTVTELTVEPGQTVSAGEQVAQVVSTSELWLTVSVDEVDVDAIEVGMPAYIELDALPDVQIPATLDRISLLGTESEGVVTYDARLDVNTADPRVRVGMTGEAFMILEARVNVLVVPNTFVQRSSDTDGTVQVITAEGELAEVAVTLGLRGDQQTEIIDGLRAGDVIATDSGAVDISLFG